MGEDGMTYGDETGRRSRPWVVILTSPQPYTASGAWLIDEGDRSEQVARDFAKFVTSEIDPAVALPCGSPTSELLSWRSSIAGPAFDRVRDAEYLAGRPDATVGELRDLLAAPYPGEPRWSPEDCGVEPWAETNDG